MPVNLEKMAKQVVDLAGNAGADDVWATVSNSRDVEFEFRDGALEKVKDPTARGLNVQVFADGRYSTHQTTDLNVDRLAGFVKEAIAITRALEPDAFRKITPEEFFNNRPVDNLDLVVDRKPELGEIVEAFAVPGECRATLDLAELVAEPAEIARRGDGRILLSQRAIY